MHKIKREGLSKPWHFAVLGRDVAILVQLEGAEMVLMASAVSWLTEHKYFRNTGNSTAATQHETALFTDCDRAPISHKLHIQLRVIVISFEKCPLLDEVLAASQTLSANQKILEKLSTA